MESAAAIDRSLTRLFLLPSHLCLDAPLVALGWAVALLADAGDLDERWWVRPLALFACVWMIYLGDRLYDARCSPADGSAPPRHRFATRQWRFLLLLLLVVGFAAAGLLLPRLDRPDLLAGLAVGGGTGIYFLVFRGLRGRRSAEWPPRLPWKESTIALWFTVGVFVAGDRLPGDLPAIAKAAALFALFLANCLLISRAEAKHDSLHDPTAYFAAERPGARRAVPGLLVFSLLIGAMLAVDCGIDRVSLSLLLGAGGTFAGIPLDRRRPHAVQPFADGVLLVPWLVVLFSPP